MLDNNLDPDATKESLSLNSRIQLAEVPRILEMDLILNVDPNVVDEKSNYKLLKVSLMFDGIWATYYDIENFPKFITNPSGSWYLYRDGTDAFADITSIHGRYDGYAICKRFSSFERGNLKLQTSLIFQLNALKI